MNQTALSSFMMIETKVFLWGTFGLLIWQIFIGKIKLRGLLRDKKRGLPISPARVQALASTLGVALYLLTQRQHLRARPKAHTLTLSDQCHPSRTKRCS
jgi:hypothetical protein